ncbi:MAG: GHMP kinase [Negativicutes bacterium]|nr:GHMP kinase [Negativicutes bacterium]
MKAMVRAPGSCGELVQGTVEGKNFLITCPVDLYSEVVVQDDASPVVAAGGKAVEAVERTWAYLGIRPERFSVRVESALPKGKGMASSSADISAACQAAAVCCGRLLTPDEIADIALAIEPTDGIFYPGIVMFDHVGGLTRRFLGFPPPLSVAIFDVGGQVDTLQFNQRSDLIVLNRAKESQVEQAVALVTRGLVSGDCGLIGQGATLSALANQSILHKACLPAILELLPRYGAVGVNTAHSGTVIGILFPGVITEKIGECIAAVQTACPELTFLRTARVITGGLTVIEGGSQ